MAGCGGCKSVCVVFLVILCIIYFILGLLLVAPSVLLFSYPQLLGDGLKVTSAIDHVVLILFLVAGILLVLAAIFGCIVACKRPFALIIVVVIMILAAMALQIGGSFRAKQNDESADVSISRFYEYRHKDTFHKTMESFWKDKRSNSDLYVVQRTFECCGFDGYMDWNASTIVMPNPTVVGDVPALGFLPLSCCIKGTSCSNIAQINKAGCKDNLQVFAYYYGIVISLFHGLSIAILSAQFLGAIIGIILAVLIWKERSDDRGQFIPMTNQSNL